MGDTEFMEAESSEDFLFDIHDFDDAEESFALKDTEPAIFLEEYILTQA